jgi:hypothetical protein
MAGLQDLARMVGYTNPATAPLVLAGDLMKAYMGDKEKQKEQQAAAEASRVGDVVSILGGRPYRIYAGKDYGPQSLESYLALSKSDPKRFPAIKGAPATPPPAATAPPAAPPAGPDWSTGGGPSGDIPDATAGWGTPGSIREGSFSEESQRAGNEPTVEAILDMLQKQFTPEGRRLATDEAIRQYAATSAISQALGAEKSRERYKREVELERIKQWTDLAKTKMQTDILAQSMLGQALLVSQQPSAAVADVLSKGAAAAQQALGGFQLRG